MSKLKYNFINPNTNDEMARYLMKTIASTLAKKLENEGVSGFTYLKTQEQETSEIPKVAVG